MSTLKMTIIDKIKNVFNKTGERAINRTRKDFDLFLAENKDIIEERHKKLLYLSYLRGKLDEMKKSNRVMSFFMILFLIQIVITIFGNYFK